MGIVEIKRKFENKNFFYLFLTVCRMENTRKALNKLGSIIDKILGEEGHQLKVELDNIHKILEIDKEELENHLREESLQNQLESINRLELELQNAKQEVNQALRIARERTEECVRLKRGVVIVKEENGMTKLVG